MERLILYGRLRLKIGRLIKFFAFSIAALVFAFLLFVAVIFFTNKEGLGWHFLKVDTCVDNGGQWNDVTDSCYGERKESQDQ